MKRAATQLFKRQNKHRAFLKIIELLLWFKTSRANQRAQPWARQKSENPTPRATRMCESPGVARGDGQAWNWLIHNADYDDVRTHVPSLQQAKSSLKKLIKVCVRGHGNRKGSFSTAREYKTLFQNFLGTQWVRWLLITFQIFLYKEGVSALEQNILVPLCTSGVYLWWFFLKKLMITL